MINKNLQFTTIQPDQLQVDPFQFYPDDMMKSTPKFLPYGQTDIIGKGIKTALEYKGVPLPKLTPESQQFYFDPTMIGGIKTITKIPEVVYHGTPFASKIIKEGFSLANSGKTSGYKGIYGSGITLSTKLERARLYGEPLSIKIKEGLKFFETDDPVTDLFANSKLIPDVSPEGVTKSLQKAGYDGVKVGDEIVVFDPKNVSVIQELPKIAPVKFETGNPVETPVVRYSKKGLVSTDEFRGGTWYMTPDSKNYVSEFKGRGKGVGGTTLTQQNISIKNPLVVKDAVLEDGSFSVINSGYEDWLPEKQRYLGNRLAEEVHPMFGRNSEKKIKQEITYILASNGNSKAEVDKVLNSTNRYDAAMDLVISKGLKENDYDALILVDRGDQHIFKFAESKKSNFGKQPPTQAFGAVAGIEPKKVVPDYLADFSKFPAEADFTAKKLDDSAESLFRGYKYNERTGRNSFISKEDAMKEIEDALDSYSGRKSFEPARQMRVFDEINAIYGDKYKSWNDIPEYIEVYRGDIKGHIPQELDNFSLNKKVAEKFAGKSGEVKKYFVHKNDIEWINQPYLGHAESEAFIQSHNLLKEIPSDKIPVQEFANKVKTEFSKLNKKDKEAFGIGAFGASIMDWLKEKTSNAFTVDNTKDRNSALYQNNLKSAIASNETGIIPEEKKYSYSKYSGVPKLGKDLGKYQITEAELKEKSKKYLGKLVSSKVFLKNPKLQEKYMDSKIKDWISKGYTDEEILAFHRGGQNVDINKPHIQEYIKKATTTFQSLNSK